jgi:hypothetical protein
VDHLGPKALLTHARLQALYFVEHQDSVPRRTLRENHERQHDRSLFPHQQIASSDNVKLMIMLILRLQALLEPDQLLTDQQR